MEERETEHKFLLITLCFDSSARKFYTQLFIKLLRIRITSKYKLNILLVCRPLNLLITFAFYVNVQREIEN